MDPERLAQLIPRDLASDPQTRANVETTLKQGYVVIPNCFTRAEALEAKAEIDRLTGKDPPTGRNVFEGARTNRIFALPNKSRVFDKFYTLPAVLALNDYFLDRNYLIYVIQSIVINPGEGAQLVHHDDAITSLPRPRAPLTAAIMACLDDYTTTNGATCMVPGSHLLGTGATPKPGALLADAPRKEDAIPITCPAGSVIYFLGTTYHGGGANVSSAPRYALAVQYCQPYIRPLEDLMLAVDPRKLPYIPQRVVEMMGYKSALPVLGSGKFCIRTARNSRVRTDVCLPC